MKELYEMAENTFAMDFSIADVFGAHAVKDTYNRAFKEWKSDYKMLTALVVTLNHKIWEHYEATPRRQNLVELYDSLWRQAQDYALDNLKGEELDYYYQITD
jgi:hypothetical protein